MPAIAKIPVQPLIRRIISENYSNQDILEFLNLSEKIAVGYLRYLQNVRQNNLLLPCEEKDSLHKLAIDCIAPLFRRDESNRFVVLDTYFSPFLERENKPTEIECFVHLKRLIVGSVKHELIRIFRERDPEGAKALRNIRNAIRKSPDLLVLENSANTYIFSEFNIGNAQLFERLKTGELTLHHEEIRKALRKGLPLMPIPELTENYLARFSSFTAYPQFIRQLLQIVHENATYANYILLEDIVDVSRLFRNKRVPLWDAVEESKTGNPEDVYYEKRLAEVVESMKDRIQALVTFKYGSVDKFSPTTLSGFRKALIDYVEDFIHKRKTPTHFQLLSRHMPGLSREVYRREYRHAFEYLVRVVRKQISEKIMKIL